MNSKRHVAFMLFLSLAAVAVKGHADVWNEIRTGAQEIWNGTVRIGKGTVDGAQQVGGAVVDGTKSGLSTAHKWILPGSPEFLHSLEKGQIIKVRKGSELGLSEYDAHTRVASLTRTVHFVRTFRRDSQQDLQARCHQRRESPERRGWIECLTSTKCRVSREGARAPTYFSDRWKWKMSDNALALKGVQLPFAGQDSQGQEQKISVACGSTSITRDDFTRVFPELEFGYIESPEVRVQRPRSEHPIPPADVGQQ